MQVLVIALGVVVVLWVGLCAVLGIMYLAARNLSRHPEQWNNAK